jgi:probable rRNA maturation factor
LRHADFKEVFVANAHPSLEVDKSRVRKAASAILRKEYRGEGRVNVVLATDGDLADLNSKYRGRDGSTDVLSFSMGGNEHVVQEEQVIGEVYVSLDRARQQAKEYKVSFAEEVDRLVIHGMLHLCGYDHEGAEDAQLMRAKEKDYLEMFR